VGRKGTPVRVLGPDAEPALKITRTMPVVLDTRVVNGSGGGPDKTIINSPRYLSAGGYRMLCAYMHPPEDPGFDQLQKKALLRQTTLLSVQDRGPWDWRVVGQLLDLCRSERVQIWHGHDYKSNALGLLLQRFWPMRLVTTVHGWVQHTRRTPVYYWIDRVCLPRYELVLCVSPDLQERCLASGVPKRRCVLLENGVDTTEYARTSSVQEAKKKLGLPPERFLIGAVGRLSDEKAFDILIRAVDQLLHRGLAVDLAIIGEGDEKLRLQKLSAELGRTERIRLVGYQTDMISWYEAMDVYALSSIREGLPNVLLEAMAVEVPIVATRIAGVPRLIQAEQNGLLVEPGSIEDLTGALARLLADEKMRERLRQSGRQTVESSYSFAARMRKIQVLYDNLLERN
jgi:glycosyltransferase involved in cell wall biosynthesis